jgi:hypothetical protein
VANIINKAEDIPFSFILHELLNTNLERSASKMKVFKGMKGSVAIDLPDIEVAVTMVFEKGNMTIYPGIYGKPQLIINTDSDKVMSLQVINIKWGLPYYFDEAGLNVVKLLLTRQLKIKGMFAHIILLTNLTKIMTVM